mgnify:CR=1 FL=1
MPDIKNCRRCRKIIMWASGPQLCEDCKRLEEEDFERVRKFVRDFPGATIQEVSAATEVSQATIHKYLKDGRLEVTADSPIAIQCENCGARIRSGRFCPKCASTLARDMMSAGRALVEEKKPASSSNDAQEEGRGLRFKHHDR